MTKSKIVVIVFLILLGLFISNVIAVTNEPHSNKNNQSNQYHILALLQSNFSSFELGYGPSTLSQTNQRIPVYTVNDELWIESNFTFPIKAQLFGFRNQSLTTSIVNPESIAKIYTFRSDIPTSNLTLEVSASQCQTVHFICMELPLQFVNPSNNTITSLTSRYSIANSSLSSSFTSPDLKQLFDIQQCITNVSSSGEAIIPLPPSIGNGYVGLVGDPNSTSARLLVQNAVPSSTFAFSFELLANYTYMIPSPNIGTAYASSQSEVAKSNSTVVETTEPAGYFAQLAFSYFTSLRSGRYILRAFFQNAAGIAEVDTRLLITSPSANSWFWLGSCQQLSKVTPPSLSSKVDLTGSPDTWPRYLYLMYQTVPGIEGFSNISLNLGLNRVEFLSNGILRLSSDIQVSWDHYNSTSSIESVYVDDSGSAYMITNGTYPASARFNLSFGGKIFATSDIVLNSAYNETIAGVGLGDLIVIALQGDNGVVNATVTISSSTLKASFITRTNTAGRASLFVPPGNYSVSVESGNLTRTSNNFLVVPSSTNSYTATFPAEINFTSLLVWIIAIITVIGAFGNFWFWFARRRIRRFFR